MFITGIFWVKVTISGTKSEFSSKNLREISFDVIYFNSFVLATFFVNICIKNWQIDCILLANNWTEEKKLKISLKNSNFWKIQICRKLCGSKKKTVDQTFNEKNLQSHARIRTNGCCHLNFLWDINSTAFTSPESQKKIKNN